VFLSFFPPFLLLRCNTRRSCGFTLSELLIAVAILGFIATFTIPKVLSSTSNAKMHTAGKEAVATLHQVLHDGWQSGAIHPSSTELDISNFLRSKINAKHFCDAGDTVGICNKPNPNDTFYNNTFVGYRFILQSGAMISLHGNETVDGKAIVHFIVDANGNEGPEIDPMKVGASYTEGGDMVFLYYNIDQSVAGPAAAFTILRPDELLTDQRSGRDLPYKEWFD
jgi:prepilin-type N-terminal cleavage/methylation domain-containing protein